QFGIGLSDIVERRRPRLRSFSFPITRCPDHQITRWPPPLPGYPTPSHPSQIGVGFRDFVAQALLPVHPLQIWTAAPTPALPYQCGTAALGYPPITDNPPPGLVSQSRHMHPSLAWVSEILWHRHSCLCIPSKYGPQAPTPALPNQCGTAAPAA